MLEDLTSPHSDSGLGGMFPKISPTRPSPTFTSGRAWTLVLTQARPVCSLPLAGPDLPDLVKVSNPDGMQEGPPIRRSGASSSDPVLEALEVLVDAYHDRSRSPHPSNTCEENGELAKDDLDEKKKLSDELRLSLLPLMKHELKTLSTALDPPPDSSKYPSPDIKLILQTLSNLDLTMQKSLHYVKSSPLKALKPRDPFDHHFEQFKSFRLYNLKTHIGFVEIHLSSLFSAYLKSVRPSNLLTKHADFPRDRAPTPREETNSCLYEIDQAIKWSQASDFALLQLKW
ncbi:hypothetical protein PGTUg99_036288 [Puccinia graminis f. sp. tritici]|uniref:Uncharacterized protein n=1 Tax=Puccinia graminis f. sp. tritici TaxID=56615 RepID=A0A5B0SPN6_PUCGR|nr:hypothetical protein PGTUg99_036288 [Puccinia graminis f. sp. tritici]